MKIRSKWTIFFGLDKIKFYEKVKTVSCIAVLSFYEEKYLILVFMAVFPNDVSENNIVVLS